MASVAVVSGGTASVELVDGTWVAELEESDGTGEGTGELVELPGLCLLAIFNRRAPREASSLCRASRALVSVGNTPWRNLSDSIWRASWILASSMCLRISCRECLPDSDSDADWSVGDPATAKETTSSTKRKWTSRIMVSS